MIDSIVDSRDIPLQEAQGMMVMMFGNTGYPVGGFPLEPTLAILRMFEGRE